MYASGLSIDVDKLTAAIKADDLNAKVVLLAAVMTLLDTPKEVLEKRFGTRFFTHYSAGFQANPENHSKE